MIKHVGVKVKDARNLYVNSLLKDDHIVVDIVNSWYVDEAEMNVELSDDDVHTNDESVDDEVRMIENDVIDVNAVVSQDVGE